MREEWKGVRASLLLHAAVAMGAWAAGIASAPSRAPLVIDLTIGGPWDPGTPAAPAPAKGPRRPAMAGRPEPPSPVTAPQAPVPPFPAVTPDPPPPTKEAKPVAAIPEPPDRQAEVAASRPTGSAGGAVRTAPPPAPAAVSYAPTGGASAGGGTPHGGSPGASSARASTGAGAAAEESGEARAVERGRYLERNYAYIRDVIQQGIAYPPMARRMGWEGKVVVAFLVLSDGSVRDVRIVQGSGHQALDRGAVEAVRKAAPFPRPPAEAEIITPVVYRLE